MKPEDRFSHRVRDYMRYRPGYPPACLDVLRARAGLAVGMDVADLGSGTGIFSELLLGAGCRIFAVEPNTAMRHAAQNVLARHAGFTSVAGRAEETTLPGASVDLVAAAQAFHWFDPPRARAEMRRILRPGGRVALLWNERITEGDPFLEAYERLLHAHGTDYAEVDHRQVDAAALAAFFRGPSTTDTLENHQDLDEIGLVGRTQSCSYMPGEGDPGHGAMLQALYELFHDHARDGRVRLCYRTAVVTGALID